MLKKQKYCHRYYTGTYVDAVMDQSTELKLFFIPL